jgi:PAS domain S-box-containing protein
VDRAPSSGPLTDFSAQRAAIAVSRTPRSNLALENPHRSGGASSHPLVSISSIGNYLAEGAIAVNARGVITYANRAAAALLGSQLESLVGRDILGVATRPGAESPQFARALADVLERGTEQLLTINDTDATGPFNVDYCRLLPIGDGGALVLLGEIMSPSVSEQLAKARLLAGMLQSINQSLEVERVFQLVAKHAAALLGAAAARVVMLDDGALLTASAVGFGAAAIGDRQSIDSSFAGQAIRSSRAVRVDDLRSVPGCRDVELAAFANATDPISAIAVPLSISDRAIGAVLVTSVPERRLTDHDEQLLITLATHAAIAVENARLYRAAAQTARQAGRLASTAERRATRLSAVAKVQLAMSRTELHDVYVEIHRAVGASVSNAGCFALLLADSREPLFRPELIAVDGVVTWSRALGSVPVTDCAASVALRTGGPVLSDTPMRAWGALVPGASASMATPAGLASEVAVPMVHGDRTLGVLIVQSDQRSVFDAEDVELLAMIARQAAAAIDNARLFEAEREARELAEAAARIARVALSSTTAADAASAILDILGDTVPLAGTAIGLLDRDDTIVYVAATGSARTALDTSVPLGASIARNVLPRATEPAPLRESDPTAVDHELARGGIVLPLAAKRRLLGVLTASAPAPNTLPQSTVDALRRLAPSVALAIDVQLLGENKRHQHERERMLATALATMDQPVFVLSLDRRVLYANDAAVREYGYALEELTAMTVDVLVASAVPLRATDDLTRTPANVVVAEHVHRRRDGSTFPATVALSFIRQDSGAPIGQVLSVRNLTDERRITEQLRQSEKLAALGELVAGVAHELNNPLAGISAFAQLLLEEEALDDDQRESARLIKREADRAVGVIRDLLLFSRKAGPSLQPVNLNALVQLTLRLRAYSLRSSGVDVETHLDTALPELTGDDQKLQQVILNLIVNAEHAMRGAVMKRLVIRTALDGDAVVVEVSDTGMGMSEDTMKRVFEPFFTTKPAGEGTGLGLSVSYGIVEAHGGTIAAESATGRGTTFRIVLPVPHAYAHARGRSA